MLSKDSNRYPYAYAVDLLMLVKRFNSRSEATKWMERIEKKAKVPYGDFFRKAADQYMLYYELVQEAEDYKNGVGDYWSMFK